MPTRLRRPAPPKVLFLTREAPPARVAVLREVLAGFGDEVDLEVCCDLATAMPGRFGAIVADGSAGADGPGEVGALRRLVEQGCPLVVLAQPSELHESWWELAGARPERAEPLGEWFLKTAYPGSELTRRLPDEFAVTASLALLELRADSTPVLSVSIGYRDHAVVAVRQAGVGRVVVTGIGGESQGGLGPEVARLLRRALLAGSAPAGRPLGLGVLGYGSYGGMGLYHGLAARATDGLELVAACDSDPGRLKAAELELPGVRPAASAEDLAAYDDVEVVVVATPPVTHFRLGLAMVRAGKHVVLEKPMCLTVQEADQLIAAAGEAGVALTVHQSRRFDPDFVAVRRMVESGALGEVFNVETFVGGFEHPCRAWHSEVAVSGGAVYDWGSHHLDWILQLMDGFPSSLVAHGHKRVWRDVTNLDQVRVRLIWDDGREAEFIQSDVAGLRRPKFYVQGTAGTLAGWYRPVLLERIEPGVGYVGERSHHAEAPVELRVGRYEAGVGLTETLLQPAALPRYLFHRNLADHLQLGEPLAVTPESVRRVVALLEAAQRSTDEGNAAMALPKL